MTTVLWIVGVVIGIGAGLSARLWWRARSRSQPDVLAPSGDLAYCAACGRGTVLWHTYASGRVVCSHCRLHAQHRRRG